MLDRWQTKGITFLEPMCSHPPQIYLTNFTMTRKSYSIAMNNSVSHTIYLKNHPTISFPMNFMYYNQLILKLIRSSGKKEKGFLNYHNQPRIQTRFKTTRIFGKVSLRATLGSWKVLHTTLFIGLMMFSTLLIQQINKDLQ